MGIVLEKSKGIYNSEAIYSLYGFERDDVMNAYFHIYVLENDYHVEANIKSTAYEITLFDDNGKQVDYMSKSIKGCVPGEILDMLDEDMSKFLKERNLL